MLQRNIYTQGETKLGWHLNAPSVLWGKSSKVSHFINSIYFIATSIIAIKRALLLKKSDFVLGKL